MARIFNGWTAGDADINGNGVPRVLGLRWRSAVAGTVAGIWVYTPLTHVPTTYVVQVYDTSETLLASETVAGSALVVGDWNQVNLTSPVAYPTPATDLVVCMHISGDPGNETHFVTDSGCDDLASDLTVGDLTGLANGGLFENGVATPEYPNGTSNCAFGVDVEFTPAAAGGTERWGIHL